MVSYFGDFAEDDTVNIPFNTFDSNDPSASVTITDFADSDIHVHKDGSITQAVTDGATVVINFDGITGNHMITIDTSAHAYYATGSEYSVRVEGTTVDGATVNAWVGAFSIERAGGALAITKLIEAAVITNAAGTDVAADIIAVKAETALIVTDTAEIGTAGAGLSDLGGMSTGMKAEVEVEVDDALKVLALDHLVSASVTGTDVADNSIVAKLVDDAATADWDNYDPATASLEALNVDTDAIKAETALIVADTDVIDDGTSGLVKIAADVAAILVDTDVIDDGTSGLVKIASDVAAILVDTDVIGAAGAGLTAVKVGTDGVDANALKTDAGTEIANAILDLANGVETSHTVRQVLRVMFAALGGKADGLETTTVHYRNQADDKNRITATVDTDGNRTAVTLDET